MTMYNSHNQCSSRASDHIFIIKPEKSSTHPVQAH